MSSCIVTELHDMEHMFVDGQLIGIFVTPEIHRRPIPSRVG